VSVTLLHGGMDSTRKSNKYVNHLGGHIRGDEKIGKAEVREELVAGIVHDDIDDAAGGGGGAVEGRPRLRRLVHENPGGEAAQAQDGVAARRLLAPRADRQVASAHSYTNYYRTCPFAYQIAITNPLAPKFGQGGLKKTIYTLLVV
jgi:hypothetical protein